MARTKQIDDETLIELISEYFISICKKNPNRISKPDIARYVENNGYPGYRVTTLRRNKVACDYIESLKGDTRKIDGQTWAYVTLDVDAFLNTNKSKNDLKRALINLDIRIRTLCENGKNISKENRQLHSEINSLNEKVAELEEKLQNSTHKYKENIKAGKDTEERIEYLEDIVNDYVYPEIANELLNGKELKNVDTIINNFKAIKKDDNILSLSERIIKKTSDDF